ncbi:MAG: 2-oxo acid dehydrogenase subunit E2 [Saccharofermentanales bacterium]
MSDETKFTKDGKEILKTIPYTGIRRIAGENVYKSLQTMAQTSSFIRINMEPLLALHSELKALGKGVTLTVLIVKLISVALEDSPMLNSQLVDKKIEVYKSKNIAIAVSTKDNLLITPVIKNVEKKTIYEIAEELSSLIEKANNRTLSMDDLSGATYTVSNTGTSEVCGMTPAVPLGTVSIIGIGNIKPEPVVDEDGNIVARKIAYFSTTSDHRVHTGHDTTSYYEALIRVFANPKQYIGEL